MNCSRKLGRTLTWMLEAANVLLLLIFLAGCGCSDAPSFDNVLQSGCDPPCWRGIVPGVTTRTEVIELLGKEPDVDDPSFPEMNWGNRCVNGRGVPQVTIWFNRSDVVASITLAETKSQRTFEDVVRERGTPSAVMVNECSPESDLGYIYLVYHKDGVAFVSGFVPVLDKPWKTPSARERVYRWIYFVPTSADKMLLEDGIIPGCGLRFYSDSSEWLGFGP